jgi:micrococcal nuclease
LGRLRLDICAWALGALLLVSTSGCGGTAATNAPEASPAASLGVGGGSLATPTATATPAPVQSAEAGGITFVNGPLSARHGQSTTLIVKTSPNMACSIRVEYKSGPSKAQGLGAKTSDGAGNVSWSWIVGTNTTAGQWPIYVTCGSASDQTSITVT